MAPITAGLLAAASIGIWFNATRWISVCAFALLSFLFPWLAWVAVIGAMWAFIHFKVRKP